MRKLIVISIFLIFIDIFLYRYLMAINFDKKEYSFEIDDKQILYQICDIELNDISDFSFNNYFRLLSFGNETYRYDFKDNELYIYLVPNRTYGFKYKLIKPEVITETIYVEKPVEVVNNYKEEENNEEYIYEDYFYIDNSYISFELDTDLDVIRDILSKNIHTSYQTNIDYSDLNVSQVGQYSVVYRSDDKEIKIIVEIV